MKQIILEKNMLLKKIKNKVKIIGIDYYFKIKEWDSLAAFIKKPNISSIPLDIYNKYLYIKM